MRKFRGNVSIFGNPVVRQDHRLIVRGEALRSLCASSIAALHSSASRLLVELRDALRHWPIGTYGMKPCVVTTARCFVPAMQRPWRHAQVRRRPVA